MSVHEAIHLREQITVYRLRLADAAADLGTALGQRGEYAEAEPLLRQALALYESCCGPDHARLAAPLSALGTACAARGRPGEAERLCRRALDLIGTRTSERS
jgi:Flp pilus assembly protein TadD